MGTYSLKALCRRYLHMAGYQEHEEKNIPIFQALESDKRAALGKYTTSIDMEVTSRKDHCTKQIKKATDLETRMSDALTKYTVKRLYVLPKMDTRPPPTSRLSEGDAATATTSGTAKTVTPKAVPELKPKTLLTLNTSRMDMMAWERAMQSYFKASNFHLCTPEVQVCYLEERMDQATARLLRKLCGEEPHKFSMDLLYQKIRESVVRTDSLQQRRITGLLAFKQHPN